MLADVADHTLVPNSDQLATICTSDCLRSLQDQSKAQTKACGSAILLNNDIGLDYPASYVDELIYMYNYTCLKDP